MNNRKPCMYCGRVHSGAAVCSSVMAANGNFPIVSSAVPRKRLSAKEAMARTKNRYKGTIAHLT